MKSLTVSLLSYIVIFNVFASDYTLTSDELLTRDEQQISYTYSWDEVQNLRGDQKDILHLTHKDNKLEVLKAKFTFFIKGNVGKFNDSFFERKDVLEGLAGMKLREERKNLYSVSRSKMGITVSANIRTLFNLDYIEYQSAFDYVEPEEDSFVTHQVTDNFNRSLERADVITQVTQQGEFVKFTIDSFTILTKKESSSFLSFALKRLLVSKMKSQMLRLPKVYIRK